MGLINNRDNVPGAYANKSRDYQVLLKLFDLVANSVKLNLENMNSLYNPDSCPDHMLPLLASYLEYDYDTNATYDANRTIMRYLPKLLKQKGNEIGMRTAMYLSCDISDVSMPDLNRIIADYDYENATIYIYYPSYLNKVRDLIEYVRPAGMKVILLTYDAIASVEVIGIYDDVYIIDQEDYYGTLKQYTSDPHSYYIMDDGKKYIIGIGTDSRSVISDGYRDGKSLIIPSSELELRYPKFSPDGNTMIDINVNPGQLNNIDNFSSLQDPPSHMDNDKYLRKIKPTPESYWTGKPELIEGTGSALTQIERQSRIGFSEIALHGEGE